MIIGLSGLRASLNEFVGWNRVRNEQGPVVKLRVHSGQFCIQNPGTLGSAQAAAFKSLISGYPESPGARVHRKNDL
jgi:hypothetical protein